MYSLPPANLSAGPIEDPVKGNECKDLAPQIADPAGLRSAQAFVLPVRSISGTSFIANAPRVQSCRLCMLHGLRIGQRTH